MAIDIRLEKLLPMVQASAYLKERLSMPRRPSMCTMWRWRLKGVRGRKLEAVIIGGRPFTSIEALERFAQHQGGTDAPAIRTPAARERAIRKAEAELDAAGI